jgi:NAD(P)H-flavin reductase
MSTASASAESLWPPRPAESPPEFLQVRRRRRETADVVTFELAVPQEHPGFSFAAGQFNMLSVFGVGEVPISISGDPADSRTIVHTVRAVGAVSQALVQARPGTPLGLRGPFGRGWPVEQAAGLDVLLVAGGVGLAPLRPALYRLLAERSRYGRVALAYGAREPAQLLFARELERWRREPGLQLRVTVDVASPGWTGEVGVVTRLLPKLRFDPSECVVMMCGPELMMRFAARALAELGVPSERIWMSLERSMKCAVGTCGHCQFGPYFVCRDGPVFRLDTVEQLLAGREI